MGASGHPEQFGDSFGRRRLPRLLQLSPAGARSGGGPGRSSVPREWTEEDAPTVLEMLDGRMGGWADVG